MQVLTEHLLDQGLGERVLSERQLERVIGGPPGRRYGLVNRALAFQGGTSPRILHKLPRFSEDLDLILQKPDAAFASISAAW